MFRRSTQNDLRAVRCVAVSTTESRWHDLFEQTVAALHEADGEMEVAVAQSSKVVYVMLVPSRKDDAQANIAQRYM